MPSGEPVAIVGCVSGRILHPYTRMTFSTRTHQDQAASVSLDNPWSGLPPTNRTGSGSGQLVSREHHLHPRQGDRPSVLSIIMEIDIPRPTAISVSGRECTSPRGNWFDLKLSIFLCSSSKESYACWSPLRTVANGCGFGTPPEISSSAQTD
jgi:hypothetical protein